jgi:hypothetical protein
MQTPQDIPARIARWLFWLGVFWAVYLAPYTLIFVLGVFMESASRWILPCVYLLAGYSVWIGWRWRSQQRRAFRVSSAFWLASALFNLIFVIFLAAQEDAHWSLVFVVGSWSIVASIASLVALYFEFRLPRYENNVA